MKMLIAALALLAALTGCATSNPVDPHFGNVNVDGTVSKIAVGRQKISWPGMDHARFDSLEMTIRPGVNYIVRPSVRGFYTVAACENPKCQPDVRGYYSVDACLGRHECQVMPPRDPIRPEPRVQNFYFFDELNPSNGLPR